MVAIKSNNNKTFKHMENVQSLLTCLSLITKSTYNLLLAYFKAAASVLERLIGITDSIFSSNQHIVSHSDKAMKEILFLKIFCLHSVYIKISLLQTMHFQWEQQIAEWHILYQQLFSSFIGLLSSIILKKIFHSY